MPPWSAILPGVSFGGFSGVAGCRRRPSREKAVRIGIDASPMFASRAGIGQYVAGLVQYLPSVEPDNEYFLYTSERVGERIGLAKGANVRLVTVPKWAVGWRATWDRIDVYHGTNYRLLGRGRRGDVLTVPDLAAERFPSLVKRGRASPKTRRTARRATAIIALSESTARDLMDLYGISRKKISVIHIGVAEIFAPAPMQEARARVRQQCGIDGPFILFAGTIEPRKNLPALIRAYASLPRIRGDFALVLAGEWGWGKSEVDRTVKEVGIEGRILLTGHVALEDLRWLYCAADLFVYPSLYEGFGLPPLEAMACGTPVITSNCSSLPEVVGDAAILADPREVEELASTITRVLEDRELRHTMRERGIAQAKRFSWETCARETLRVYAAVGARG